VYVTKTGAIYAALLPYTSSHDLNGTPKRPIRGGEERGPIMWCNENFDWPWQNNPTCALGLTNL